jgi:hypothetical protein
MKKKKNITINDLAVMVKKGFDGVDKRFDNLTKEMRFGFDRVDKRFDRLENLILVEYRTRIEKLEKKVEKLEEILAVK